MPNIEITIERTFRICETIRVSRKTYNEIRANGALPEDLLQSVADKLPKDGDSYTGQDYAVCNEDGTTLIPWVG